MEILQTFCKPSMWKQSIWYTRQEWSIRVQIWIFIASEMYKGNVVPRHDKDLI